MPTAQTTPISGRVLKVEIGSSAAGPWTDIKGMTDYTKNRNVRTEATSTFDTQNAYVDVGSPEVSYTYNGLAIPADPGQIAVRDAAATQAAVFLRVLPMGRSGVGTEDTLGWTHEVKVSTGNHTGRAAGGAQGWSFTAVGQADEVITATGYIL